MLGSLAPWTEDDILVIRTAIRSGILTVHYAGPPARTITYQSLAEMRKLLAEMTRDVAGDVGAPRYRLARTRKGFDRTPRGGFRRNE